MNKFVYKMILNTKILFVLSAILYLALCHSFPIFRHQSSPQCTSVGPNNRTGLGFGNCGENLYYINIGIGTPPQTLGVQFDTGSNILWVPTQFVSGVTPQFNTSQSSTFQNTSQPGGVAYVDGSGVNGTYGTDIFQIAGSLINITTQYLWVTSQISMTFPPQVQGLVGMGYTNIPNFLDVAYAQGLINSPVFALQIMNQSMSSTVYYNQIPQEILNQTVFVPVVGNQYWQVDLVSVSVGGVDMTSYAANVAVIDSGTSYFYVNDQLYNQILSQPYFSNSNCEILDNTPYCYCSAANNWPTFAFNFNSVEVYIYPSQYTAQSDGICYPMFGSISGFSQILLGDIFFRGYIITFDKLNSQIGFTSNNLTPSTPVNFNTSTIIGWILYAILLLLIIMGITISCHISSFISSLQTDSLAANLELSGTGTPKLQTRFL